MSAKPPKGRADDAGAADAAPETPGNTAESTAGSPTDEAKAPLDAWAERYLDLWQRQLAAMGGDMGGDARVAELTTETLRLMNAGVDTLATLAEAGGHVPNPFLATAFASAPGSAAAGAASRAASPDIHELTRRVADLEERIARLESAPPRRRASTAKRRPKRAT